MNSQVIETIAQEVNQIARQVATEAMNDPENKSALSPKDIAKLVFVILERDGYVITNTAAGE